MRLLFASLVVPIVALVLVPPRFNVQTSSGRIGEDVLAKSSTRVAQLVPFVVVIAGLD